MSRHQIAVRPSAPITPPPEVEFLVYDTHEGLEGSINYRRFVVLSITLKGNAWTALQLSAEDARKLAQALTDTAREISA